MSEQTTASETAGPARTTLVGHDSEATAYMVADYPYGFRLRCQIRYWVETTKHGQRLVSQTSNPKRGGIWNKPKRGVYHSIAIMTLDGEGHVQISVLSAYASSEPTIQAFAERHGAALTSDYHQRTLRVLTACARASEKVTVTVRVVRPGEVYQTREEQAAIMSAAVRSELRALAVESEDA
jgi:hypothetical protein